MQVRRTKPAHIGLYVFAVIWLCVLVPLSVAAAPYAAMVMDARTGEVLHSRNADTRLHPASLTKMMTLYIAFEAVRNGEITLDTKVRISKHAASEPPSKLGLTSGQRIAFRYLIRAAAVKSANDAATAIGEAIEGSEAAFAEMAVSGAAEGSVAKPLADMTASEPAAMTEFLELELHVDDLGPGDIHRRRRIAEGRRRASRACEGQRDQGGGGGEGKFHESSFRVRFRVSWQRNGNDRFQTQRTLSDEAVRA